MRRIRSRRLGLLSGTLRSVFVGAVLLVLPSQGLLGENMSVEDAAVAAVANSQSLMIRRHEEQKAQHALAEARGRLWPKIDLQASASYLTNPQEGMVIRKGSLGYAPSYDSPFPTAIPDQDFVLVEDPEDTYFSISGTLTQPLFTWFKLKNAISAATVDFEIARYGTYGARQAITRDVRLAYFGGVLARESVGILQEALATANEILRDRQRSFDEGIINLYTLLEAKSNLAAMQSQLVQAHESYATALAMLGYFTGTDTASVDLISEFRTNLPGLDEDTLRTVGLQLSSDLNIARSRLQQARAFLRIQRGALPLLPDVSLVVKIDVTGQRVPVLGANWTESWDTNVIVTLGTQTKLFDGLQSYRKVGQAQEQLEMAAIGLSELEKASALQIRRAIEAVRIAHATLEKQEAKLDEVREQYKNAQVSYQNDLITRQEERSSRLLMHATELERIVGLYSLERALTELEFLVGDLVADDSVADDSVADDSVADDQTADK